MSFQDRIPDMDEPVTPGDDAVMAPPMPAQMVETVFACLSAALPVYAARNTFQGALDDQREFALREQINGATLFRHFDGRVSGLLERRKLKMRVVGVSAAQIMRDVVATYCIDPGGRPQRAQIATGGRVVYVAATKLSGDRLVRHACYDSVLTDRAAGKRVAAATLLLRPLAPPTLVLKDPISLPKPAEAPVPPR